MVEAKAKATKFCPRGRGQSSGTPSLVKRPELLLCLSRPFLDPAINVYILIGLWLRYVLYRTWSFRDICYAISFPVYDDNGVINKV